METSDIVVIIGIAIIWPILFMSLEGLLWNRNGR